MASTDARPVPRKNIAYRHYMEFRDNTGALIPTVTGQDTERSLDGATFADCTNEFVEIGATGCGYIDLTLTEMNVDALFIKATCTNTNATPYTAVLYPEEVGDIRVNVTAMGDTALSARRVPYLGIADQGTAASISGTTLNIATGHGYGTNTLNGSIVMILGSSAGNYPQWGVIASHSGDAFILKNAPTVTPTGTITYIIFGVPASNLDTAIATIAKLEGFTNGTGFTAPALAASPAAVAPAFGPAAATSGTTTTLICPTLSQSDVNYWAGAEVRIKTGSSAGQTAIVTAFNQVSHQITFDPPLTQAITTNTFELHHKAPVYNVGTLRTLDSLDANQNAKHVITQARLPAALVGGRMDSSTGAMQGDVFTSAALATDALTEIQTGLATAAALASVATGVSAIAAVSTAVGLIKGQTDKLVFNGSGHVSAQVVTINGVTVQGVGTDLNPWHG